MVEQFRVETKQMSMRSIVLHKLCNLDTYGHRIKVYDNMLSIGKHHTSETQSRSTSLNCIVMLQYIAHKEWIITSMVREL